MEEINRTKFEKWLSTKWGPHMVGSWDGEKYDKLGCQIAYEAFIHGAGAIMIDIPGSRIELEKLRDKISEWLNENQA